MTLKKFERQNQMKMKPRIFSALLSAISLTFLITIVLPVQSYLGNSSEFGFGVVDLLKECIVLFMASTMVLGSVLFLSEKILGRFFHSAIIGLAICAYLETGFLAYGLGDLDGNVWLYTNVTRKIVDAAILFAVFLVFTVGYKWVRKYLHYVALVLVVMSCAAIVDTRTDAQEKFEQDIENGFCSKFDVARSLSFSPVRNIMVLVLDSVPASLAKEVIDENEDIKSKFPGFIAFDNNIAMHDVTRRGMPGLLTGEYYGSNGMSLVEYSKSLYGTNSFFYPYFKAHNIVHMLGGVFESGYTNRRKSFSDKTKVGDATTSVFFRRANSIPYLNLYETIKFRLSPYKVKSMVLYSIIRTINPGPLADADDSVVSNLAIAPIENEQTQALLMLHTRGIHLPILIGKNGQHLTEANDTREGAKDFTYYLLSLYGDLFNTLRIRGIYDKCMIVITTDHGSPLLRTEDLMGQPDAVLWVKPIANLDNAFEHSNIPTSHCKIAELVRCSQTDDLSGDKVKAILRQDTRLYRGKPNRLSPFEDYVYDADGNLVERKHNSSVSDT